MRCCQAGRIPRRLRAPSPQAWLALVAAAERLGFESVQQASLAGALGDILSDAIEAEESR